MSPSREELGVGYLLGAGVALLGSQLGYLVVTDESPIVAGIGATMAVLLFLSIVYVGVLVLNDELPEAFVWTIAQWFALGLGLATLFTVAVILVRESLPGVSLLPSLFTITIAAGGVIGGLVGLVVAFREHYRRLRDLYQRNTVMNRVLRHDVRNDMNVISGHAELIMERPEDAVDHAAVIKRKTEEVIDLSRAAREIESLETGADTGPVDVASMAEQYVETARESYPDATITCDRPPSAWAAVDRLFRSVLDNLVENAIEHNGPDTTVRVTVDGADAGDWIDVRVADDGTGIPDGQREVLSRGAETATDHGEGLGLWLVQWFVDHHDGDLRFEASDSGGALVELRLPAAERPAR